MVQHAMANNSSTSLFLRPPSCWTAKFSNLLKWKMFYLRKASCLASSDYSIKYKGTSATLRQEISESKRMFWDFACATLAILTFCTKNSGRLRRARVLSSWYPLLFPPRRFLYFRFRCGCLIRNFCRASHWGCCPWTSSNCLRKCWLHGVEFNHQSVCSNKSHPPGQGCRPWWG